MVLAVGPRRYCVGNVVVTGITLMTGRSSSQCLTCIKHCERDICISHVRMTLVNHLIGAWHRCLSDGRQQLMLNCRKLVVNMLRVLVAGCLAIGMLATATADVQPADAPRDYSQDELDQLLAPIALYPDQLLTQILIAATYPLEVVEAARFVQQNPTLTGEQLDQALAGKPWDPSVQSVAAFPQVLAMMNDKLEWTQSLGDAFLIDEQRVMDAVQALRHKARAAGNLRSTPQQSVIDQDNDLVIEPAQPDVVYVPVYDPSIIYGPWWAPAYPPWFWYPPAVYGYGGSLTIAAGIVFGGGYAISHHHWGWGHPDWHGHHINIDPSNNRFWNRPGRPSSPPGTPWQHTPGHRRGVAYPDAATRDRFIRVDPNAVRARQEFRGYEPRPSAPGVVRLSPNVPRPMPQDSRPLERQSAPIFDP